MLIIMKTAWVFDLPKTWVKGADRKPDIIWICHEDERDVNQLGDAKLDQEPAVRLTSMLDTETFMVRNTALVALHEGKSYVVVSTGEQSMPQAELQKMTDASIPSWHWVR